MKLRAILAGALLSAALSAGALAANDIYKVDLKGASEVPPNDSKGSGTASFTFDPARQYFKLEDYLFRPDWPCHHGAHSRPRRPRQRGAGGHKIRKPGQSHRWVSDAHRRAGRRSEGRHALRQRPHCGPQRRRNPRPNRARQIVPAQPALLICGQRAALGSVLPLSKLRISPRPARLP